VAISRKALNDIATVGSIFCSPLQFVQSTVLSNSEGISR
jgi:hypothetical protein